MSGEADMGYALFDPFGLVKLGSAAVAALYAHPDPFELAKLVWLAFLGLCCWSRQKFDASPPRAWHEIDRLHKLGRMLLIIAALALFIVPASLFLMR
jgi:hypothetical protein